MSPAATPRRGKVRNLHTSEVIGEYDDMVAGFVALVRRNAEEGPVYVVVGTKPSHGEADGLEEALLALGVPMRHDPAVGPTAQIISGSADEWDGEFRAAMIATLRVHGVIPPAVGP